MSTRTKEAGLTKVRSSFDAAMLARWHKEYHPCENGVHVFQPEGGEFGGITLRNYPGETLGIFRQLSSAGEDDDFDLICDLIVGGDIVDDVVIRRQDVAVIDAALAKVQP